MDLALSTRRFLNDTPTNMGIVFIMLGAIAGFISLGLKYHWERVAKEALDDFRHQIAWIPDFCRGLTSENYR